MSPHLILALDPGFGNTKACLDGAAASIQTAIARPTDIGRAASGLRTTRKAIQVDFDGQSYVVGPRAWSWGAPLTSLDYSAISSPPRRALFYAAVHAASPYTVAAHIDQLVVGLPVPLLQDQAQAAETFAALKAYKGHHEFTVAGDRCQLEIAAIKVLAQPVGAYADWLLDDDLDPRLGAKRAEVAVLDIGLNTLDLYVLQAGQVAPRFVHGAKAGTRRLLEALNGYAHDLEEVDADLRAGRLRANAAELETWLSEILAHVERAWPSLRRFDALIPTGGGALLLGDRLQSALIAAGAAVHWPADPITANVRGLWKYYAHKAARKAARRSK